MPRSINLLQTHHRLPASQPMETLERRLQLAGDGLSAAYFDNATLSGTPLQRIETQVDFTWGTGSPDPSIPADSFSARWTGQIQTIESGTYTFFTNSDEGVRLWIDGQLLIDNWTAHAATENSGAILLAADTKYDIKIEYYEGTGNATMQLSWQRPGQAKAIIPQAQLFALNFDTSWFGNTFGESGRNSGTWVQQWMHDIWVKSDGRIYANSQWDEGGREAGIYQNGQVLGKMAGDTHNFLGGRTVAGNGTHVWLGQKGGYVRRYNPDGSTAGSRITVTTGTWGPTGLAASATELFISDGPGNLIKVFNALTMAQSRNFAFSNPGKLSVAPDGTLWIICTDDGSGNTIVRHYSSTGTLLSGTIAGDKIMDVEFDNQGRLMVANAGQTQQVKFYDVSGTPALVETLGVLGGILGGAPGVVAPDKFNGITGVGTDAAGNIYVSTSGLENSSWGTRGAELHAFTAAKTHLWSLQGLMFIDAADADPASPADVYSAHEHYVMDYADSTPGGEWNYQGYTINATLYPNDPRARGRFYSVRAQRIDGELFLYMNEMNGKELTVYRMEGEIAVPAAMWSHGSDFVPTTATPPGTNWFWRDANGNGQFETSEFQSANTSQSISGNVDSNGDVWVVKWFANAIHRYENQGVDANGVPIYSTSALTTYTRPPLFPYDQLVQAHYQPETDTMLLAGFTSAYPRSGDQFMPLGRVVARYDNWSIDPVTEDDVFVLPFNASSAVAKSMAVEGEYLFVGYAKAEQVVVYDIQAGRLVGHLRPGPEINNEHGDLDIPYGVQAVRRQNGEYIVFHEDDRYAKQVMYRWIPDTAATQPGFSQSWDFGSDAGKANAASFSKTNSSTRWSLQPDALRGKGGASNTAESATTQVPELGDTLTSFQITLDATPTSFRYSDRFGIQALAASSGNQGLVGALFRNEGATPQIQLRTGGISGSVVATQGWGGALGGAFSLVLASTLDSGGQWDVQLTVTDQNAHAQTISLDNYASSGQWIGMALYGRDVRPVDFGRLTISNGDGLAAPSALTAQPSGGNVALSWQDTNSEETGFRIERKTAASGTWAEIGVVGANVTSFTDTGAAANTTYVYRVRAYDLADQSSYSNEATVTTPPASGTTVSWDFGSGAGKDGTGSFVTAGGGSWSLEDDAWRHVAQSGSSGTAGVATTSLPGLGANDFLIRLRASTGSFGYWDRFGAIALGSSSGDGGLSALLNYNSGSPQLLLRAGGIESGSNLASAAWTGSTGGSFEFVIQGVYAGSNLNLTFQLTDDNGHTQSLTWTVSAAAYSGDYLGFGHDGGGSRSVSYDELIVEQA
jgi:hypothetical protein